MNWKFWGKISQFFKAKPAALGTWFANLFRGKIVVALATIVAASATVVYTIFADHQWHVMRAQWLVMKAQLREMQAEQRPWVSLVKGADLQSVYFDRVNGQLDAVVNFSLKNTGKSPATSVFINARMNVSPRMPYGSMKAWQMGLCHLSTGLLGFALFPGASEPIYQLTIPAKLRELTPGARSVPFWTIGGAVIAGCIVYRDAISGVWHYTPIAFQIFTRPQLSGKARYPASIGHRPIKGDKFVFRQWDWDNLPPT